MKINRLYIVAFLFSLVLGGYSQETGELEKYLKELEAAHEKKKPEIYNKIAWYYRVESKSNSIKYAEKSIKLVDKLLEFYANEEKDSTSKKLGIYVLEKEKAEALYILGFLDLKKEKYDEALNYEYKSLDIFSKINNDFPHDIEAKQYIANLLNDIGYIYKSIGRYDEAIKNYKMAVEINEELGALKESGVNFNNLGVVYNKTLQYEESANSFENALDIAIELNQEQNIAVQHNNMGQIFLSMGDYKKAKENFTKSLKTCEKNNLGNNQRASIITNLGMAELSNGNFDGAAKYFDEAKAIFESTGYEAGIAEQLNNLGMVYKTSGDYEKILPYYNEALEINKKIGAGDSYARNLSQLGDIHAANKEIDKAIEKYESSIQVYDQLKTDIEDFKIFYITQDQLDVYDKLINAHFLNGNKEIALFTLEMARAKKYAELFDVDFNNFFVPSLRQIQEELTSDDIIFDFEYLQKDEITAFIITKDNFDVVALNKAEMVQRFNETFLSVSGTGRSFFKKSKYGKYEDKDDFNSILQYFRRLLMDPEPDENTTTKRIYLGKIVYNFLFDKVEDKLQNKNKVYILANGALQSIPMEALVSPREKYFLIEKDIAYIPSLSSMKMINQRRNGKIKKDLLMLNAEVKVEKSLKATETNIIPSAYKSSKYKSSLQVSIAEEPLLNEDQKLYLRRKIDELIKPDTSLLKVYNWLGYNLQKNQNSKEKDLELIADNFRRSDIEQLESIDKLKELSSDGELQEYKYLHLAAPGIGFPEIPKLNTLLVQPTANDDGLVNIFEISQLKFKADAISLPDFNTDDRKNYVGDGAVAVAASLIYSGCNAVNIAYWNTDEDARYFFMNEVYKMLSENENMSFYKAMTEVKRKMIRWEYDKALSNPYYWATFMYFGS